METGSAEERRAWKRRVTTIGCVCVIVAGCLLVWPRQEKESRIFLGALMIAINCGKHMERWGCLPPDLDAVVAHSGPELARDLVSPYEQTHFTTPAGIVTNYRYIQIPIDSPPETVCAYYLPSPGVKIPLRGPPRYIAFLVESLGYNPPCVELNKRVVKREELILSLHKCYQELDKLGLIPDDRREEFEDFYLRPRAGE